MALTDEQLETWHKRITAARRRREKHESTWAQYAILHAKAYTAQREKNEDLLVSLPGGDMVRVGLVHRNLEQTFALLDLPEIGVRATANDITRELGQADTHREAVVETALVRSMARSGLTRGRETADGVKRDGVIVGHGINFTHWDVRTQAVEQLYPVLTEAEVPQPDGSVAFELLPVTDDAGLPLLEPKTEERTIYEGVRDCAVSPLEFLFDAASRQIRDSDWYGWERVASLDTLKADQRYEIPEGIEGSACKRKDLYGMSGEDPEEEVENGVSVVTIWNKPDRALLTFLETTSVAVAGDTKDAKGYVKRAAKRVKEWLYAEKQLLEIGNEPWPVTFDLPDDSPFSFFIPMPANDLPFGISQVEHIRNTGVEADKTRTRMANLLRQFKRILWYRKGRVDPLQVDAAIKSPDAGTVGLDINEGEKPESLFGELATPAPSAELYKAHAIFEDDVRKTSGVSETPWGGAGTATESENIMAVGSARPKRKKRIYLDFMTDVGRKHLAFLREFAPEGQTQWITDEAGAQIPVVYGREAFQGSFELEVLPGGGAMTATPVQQKTLIELGAQLLGKYGPRFDKIFLREAFTRFDLRNANALAAAIGGPESGVGSPGSVTAGSPRAAMNPNDYTEGQALRAAVNARNE